jgi:hypothetical protein
MLYGFSSPMLLSPVLGYCGYSTKGRPGAYGLQIWRARLQVSPDGGGTRAFS